jgi:hypothetical protein
VAYVEICQILGHVAQSRRRNQVSASQRKFFEHSLYHWIRELPPELRLFLATDHKTLNTYNVESWQLHVAYFVILIILSKSNSSGTLFTESIGAASFIAGIYAEFGKRDDLRHLGPIFAFHALVAALSLLEAYKYASLTERADQDFMKIFEVLQRLSKRWGSARGVLGPLMVAKRSAEAQPKLEAIPRLISASMKPLFREFGSGLCSLWDLCCEHPTTSMSTEQLFASDDITIDLQLPEDAFSHDTPASAPALWDFQQDDLTTESNTLLLLDQEHHIEDQDFGRQWNDLLGSWTFQGSWFNNV